MKKAKLNDIICDLIDKTTSKFKEYNALLTQMWVMDPKKKVKDIIKEFVRNSDNTNFIKFIATSGVMLFNDGNAREKITKYNFTISNIFKAQLSKQYDKLSYKMKVLLNTIKVSRVRDKMYNILIY